MIIVVCLLALEINDEHRSTNTENKIVHLLCICMLYKSLRGRVQFSDINRVSEMEKSLTSG